MPRNIAVSEVSEHNTPADAWVVVDNNVYDMTDFAPSHPGGAEIIYRHAGHDASRQYNEVHAPSLIQKTLTAKQHVGVLDESTVTDEWRGAGQVQHKPSPGEKPSLDDILNLHDFEDAARQGLSPKSWAYIYGASNDNITRDANMIMLKRIWLRPAIMTNVAAVDTKTRLFGCNLDLPVYISPTGAVKTASEEGEVAQAKGAAASGIIQCMSTPASFPHEEIIDATPQHAFFQLYVDRNRQNSENALRKVIATGKIKAIFVTVDLPVVSKREADDRINRDTPLENPNANQTSDGKPRKAGGLARRTGAFIDPTFNWADMSWIRRVAGGLPVILKGIQRWEDAKLAMQHKCEGIVVSNHGGRAADGAAATIITLLELHRNCPEIFDAMDVLVDGGFRRGSDVVKAMCLGASAVGMGRPFMYAVNYGEEGVQHAVDILRDEIETAMRLCGMTSLRDASPNFVNTGDVDHLVQRGGHPYAVKSTKARL